MNQAENHNKQKKQEVFAFVPSYNHAPFIEKCLRSIIKQTLSPTKLLVIDDGSKDDSPKIIERALKNCPFDAELIARDNRGLCATLNEGYAKSSGEYFAYLGSDDVWLSEFLENRAGLLDSRPKAVLAYGHAYTIDADDNIIDSSADWANFPDGDAGPMLERGFAPFSPTVCYCRKSLEDIRWNEDSRLEDYEFYLQLSRKGEFAFDSQTLAAWRQHESNTSHNWQMMLGEVLAAQKRNAAKLGIEEKQLTEIQTATKLFYSENLARSGDKAAALDLFLKGLNHIDSPVYAAKSLFRILTPMPILRRYRQKMQREKAKKYGKIKI
ncbi:MAG TPA: glycosyltransferase family A protein [Pyrinomonadaceae bacterium]|jgi:alpha-1,3-rhamnosyltransferase